MLLQGSALQWVEKNRYKPTVPEILRSRILPESRWLYGNSRAVKFRTRLEAIYTAKICRACFFR